MNAAGPAPVIWITRSELDGYFVAVFASPPGDVEAARAKAWRIYTGEENRPEADAEDGKPGWMAYHTDPRGLAVFELGDAYVGADGEGHFEVDGFPADDHPGAPVRCEEAHPTHGRCALPIGHGPAISYPQPDGTLGPHRWADPTSPLAAEA